MFALSFWLLATERVILVMLDPVTFVYLIRSLAFAVIVLAVVDKNRATGPDPA